MQILTREDTPRQDEVNGLRRRGTSLVIYEGERRAYVVAVLRPSDGLHSVVPRPAGPVGTVTFICGRLHIFGSLRCLRHPDQYVKSGYLAGKS